MAETKDTLRVFISYARRDASAFAEELLCGLEVAGFEAFLDRHDIEAGVDWEARLGGLIQSADTVVFVISPAAVASERCDWEVKRAEALSKRVIPVVHVDVPEEQAPLGLKRLNYIFFNKGSFTPALGELARALRVDFDWIREHTRLGELAQRWQARNRSEVLLLRGEELAAARAWVSAWKAPAPEPTDLHRAFINESETAEGAQLKEERERLQRQARMQRIAGYAIAAAFALTSVGAWLVIDGRRELGRAQSLMLAQIGYEQFEAGDYPRGLRFSLLAAQESLFSPIAREQSEDALVSNWAASRLETELRAPSGVGGGLQVGDGLIFSDDGARILTWRGATARLWNPATGAQIGVALEHEDNVQEADFSSDGARILTRTYDEDSHRYTARLWNAEGAPIGPVLRDICGSFLAPGGPRVVSCPEDGTARAWNAATGAAVGPAVRHEQRGAGNNRVAADISADGSRILTFTSNRLTARLWDAATGAPVGSALQHEQAATTEFFSAAFSPDGARVVTWSSDGTARLWNAATGAPIGPALRHGLVAAGPLLRARPDLRFSAEFSPDGARLLTRASGRDARLWDAANGQPIGAAMGGGQDLFNNGVSSARFVVVGEVLGVLTTTRGTVQLWDADTGERFGDAVWPGHGEDALWPVDDTFAIRSVDMSFPRFVIVPFDGPAQVWGYFDARPRVGRLGSLQHDQLVDALFSPDGSVVLTRGEDGTARLWSRFGDPIGSPLRHERLSGARFSPDGARVVTWGGETARIWKPAARAIGFHPAGGGGVVRAADFAAGDTRILTRSESTRTESVSGEPIRPGTWVRSREIVERTWRLWDAEGEPVGPALQLEGRPVEGALLSADLARILAWGAGTARILNAATGAPLGPPLRHEGLSGAGFSTDGARILTWGGGTARAWNTASGAPLGPPLRHEGLSGADFSADGARVLTWGGGTAQAWNAASGARVGQPLRHEALDGAHFSADGARIRTISGESGRSLRGIVRLWEAGTGASVGSGIADVCSVVSEGASRIVSCGADGAVQVWDAASGERVGPALRHEGAMAAFTSADGARVVTWSASSHRVGSSTRFARLWNGATGRQLGPDHVFPDESLGLINDFAASFSTDGERVLTWGQGKVLLLSAASGARIGAISQQNALVWGARFSGDEARVLTWSGDFIGGGGSARLWSAATGARIGPDLQQNIAIIGASFTGDGARIVTWGGGNVRLWDVSWARPRRSIAELRREVCAAAPVSADFVLPGQTAAGFRWPWQARPIRSSIRRIDARDIELAPILRGREGEDVCED